MPPIGLLLISAAIGLHADIVGDLPKAQAQDLIATIERAAAKRAQAPVACQRRSPSL